MPCWQPFTETIPKPNRICNGTWGENDVSQEFLVAHGLMEDPERAQRRQESRQELEMLALAAGQPDHPLLDPTSPEAQAIFPATCYQLMGGN